jgi:hypothetical protein
VSWEEEVMRETWGGGWVCVHLCRFASHPQLLFFPISFFNCKYSTSHYYDAFLGSDFSFWGNFIFIFVVFGEYTFDE